MSGERWRQANALFEQALAVAEADRGAWLDAACADRPDLREAVARRLRVDAAAEAEDFLEHPSPSISTATPTSPSALSMPERVGPYRISGLLGRGGMGMVYAAERDDDAFQRRVALKVISADQNSEEITRRLRTERRILALLEHPNIARIDDGGALPDGRPYFVMELVAGVPIDRYCADHQLSVPQRLALVVQVCRAVDYAHRNLVVHRDLKPSNILVRDDGVVKLLDFGIAKVLDHEVGGHAVEATVPWRQRLTLHWASPEQIRGRPISTASDVYGLGVLLFWLLTETLPRAFDGMSPWEVEERMTATEVPRPSIVVRRGASVGTDAARRARQLVGDLDAIVTKALRSDPEARYHSAGTLADDLERFQRGLPVTARRGSLRYRVGKLLRRHRAVAAVSLVALFLGAAYLASRWRASERLARDQARLEAEQAKLEATLDFLLGIFEDAGPYVAEGVPISLREAVDRQAERVDVALAGQPVVEAVVRSTLGWVYLDLGALEESLASHQRALDLYRTLGDSGSPVAEGLDGVAAALREQWQLDRAEALSARALELHRRSGTGARRLVRSLNERVKLMCFRREWEAADALSSEALALARDRDADAPTDLAIAMVQRALVLRNLGRGDEAARLYRRAASALSSWFGDDHAVFAALFNNLAHLEAEAGRTEAAMDHWRRADAQYVAAFGEDFYDRVIPLSNLGGALRDAGEVAEAEAVLRAALDVATRSPALGPEHQIAYFGRPAVVLGALLANQGRCAEVESLLGSRLDDWAERSSGRIVAEARKQVGRCRGTAAPTATGVAANLRR